MTRLASRLPKGEANGLDAIGQDLIASPHRAQIVIAVLDCGRIITDPDTDDVQATARIRRVERVVPADLGTAEKLLRRGLELRSGKTVLALDLEDEIAAIFASAAETDTTDGEDGTR